MIESRLLISPARCSGNARYHAETQRTAYWVRVSNHYTGGVMRVAKTIRALQIKKSPPKRAFAPY